MPEEQTVKEILVEIKGDIINIQKYISGEYPCSVSRTMGAFMEKISSSLELLTKRQLEDSADITALKTTVYGKKDDPSDSGLKGVVSDLVKEMKFIKWVGGIIAGTGLAALVTYWINLMLVHGVLK
jgi:hypothetical protein